MLPDGMASKSASVLAALRRAGLRVALAESCTGGLVATALTDIAGASDVFERGFVTYSNQSKIEVLGVDPELLRRHGAVSPEVAMAMAEGALRASAADVAVAVTGVAGPTGGSPEKPVGLVHFGVARVDGKPRHVACNYGNVSRSDVRINAARWALMLLAEEALRSRDVQKSD